MLEGSGKLAKKEKERKKKEANKKIVFFTAMCEEAS